MPLHTPLISLSSPHIVIGLVKAPVVLQYGVQEKISTEATLQDDICSLLDVTLLSSSLSKSLQDLETPLLFHKNVFLFRQTDPGRHSSTTVMVAPSKRYRPSPFKSPLNDKFQKRVS